MKKIIACFCLLLLLSGCNSAFVCENENYRIFRQDGKTYMEFFKEYVPDGVALTEQQRWLTAGSLRELRSDILNGRLSDLHLHYLRGLSEGSVLEVMDPEDLHEPALPEGMVCRNAIWSGDRYSFLIESDIANGQAWILSREAFEEAFQLYYTWETGHEEDHIAEERNFLDRNALYTRFTNYTQRKSGGWTQYTITVDPDQRSPGCYEYLRYCIASRKGNVYVAELYVMGSESSVLYPEEEELIPERVYLFCESPDGYLAVTLEDIQKRPGVEWLAEFGVK